MKEINGFTYDWGAPSKRWAAIRHRLAHTMANTAVTFFVDSFRREGWQSRTLKKWKPRKRPDRARNAKRILKRRGLLVKSGRLRNSIKPKKVSFERIIIASDAPYSAAHNFGYKGTVKVREHTRRTYGVAQFGGRRGRVVAGSTTVRQHTRKMNLPRRQFMGKSPALDAQLTNAVRAALEEIIPIN